MALNPAKTLIVLSIFQVSSSLLHHSKYHRDGDIGNTLSRCLDYIYDDLPDVLIRVQEEDLFCLADICLNDPLAIASLKKSILRCILISTNYCTRDHIRLLNIWTKAHNAVSCCDCTLLVPFQRDLVLCFRAVAKHSRFALDQGEMEIECLLSDSWTPEILSSYNVLGKRSRCSGRESHEETVVTSKLQCTRQSEQFPVASITNAKSSFDNFHPRSERDGPTSFEVALIDGAINACESLIEKLRMETNKSSAVLSFCQLQSTIMVLEDLKCPLAWEKIVVRYKGFSSQFSAPL
jgi:hypothetical protein